MLEQWAKKWNIPTAALKDLVTLYDPPPTPSAESTEAGVQARLRLNASKEGWRLWRNNNGAFKDETGRWIRYGLCNSSKQQQQKLKSSDLIGIRPVIITPDMVGTVIGQFVAREVKRPGWKFSLNDRREQAQAAFLNIINLFGGDAKFSTGELC